MEARLSDKKKRRLSLYAMPSEKGAKRRASGSHTDGHRSKKSASTSQDSAVLRSGAAQALGPVLVSLAEFRPERGTDFALYRAPHDTQSDSGDAASMDDRLLLAGDTPVMQYTSGNWGWGASAQAPQELRRETRGYSGDYLMGVYDKTTQQVTLRAVPLFSLQRSVKALTRLGPMASDSGQSNFDYTKARRDLGDAFGNKKQKQAARNMDRMKVNTENMDHILEHVATGIEAGAASLPTDAELATALSASRALPQAHLEADEPSAVYPVDELIPPTVLKALHTRYLLKSTSKAELSKALRSLALPSPWLLPRMWQLIQTAQNDDAASSTMDLVRIGYYLSLLLAFRKHARALDKDADGASVVADKMRLPDHEKELVMEHLLSQFAEQARGSPQYVSRLTPGRSSPRQDRRACLRTSPRSRCTSTSSASRRRRLRRSSMCLRSGTWRAHTRLNDMFKSLGCSSAQSTKHSDDGSGGVATTQERRWRLRLPLSFPTQRKRGPPRR